MAEAVSSQKIITSQTMYLNKSSAHLSHVQQRFRAHISSPSARWLPALSCTLSWRSLPLHCTGSRHPPGEFRILPCTARDGGSHDLRSAVRGGRSRAQEGHICTSSGKRGQNARQRAPSAQDVASAKPSSRSKLDKDEEGGAVPAPSCDPLAHVARDGRRFGWKGQGARGAKGGRGSMGSCALGESGHTYPRELLVVGHQSRAVEHLGGPPRAELEVLLARLAMRHSPAKQQVRGSRITGGVGGDPEGRHGHGHDRARRGRVRKRERASGPMRAQEGRRGQPHLFKDRGGPGEKNASEGFWGRTALIRFRLLAVFRLLTHGLEEDETEGG